MAPAAMCFGKASDGDPAALQNEQIEKQIRQDKKRMDREIKMLLLGAGESGKSTILKQMRLIHSGGFNQSDRKQWRSVIFTNFIHAFQVIFRAMEMEGEKFENRDNESNITPIVMDPELVPDEPMPVKFLGIFKSLWADKTVQQTIERGNEIALHDNFNYFFNDIDRIFAPDYLPTDQDILRARLRTTGISETRFDLGNLIYRMFDVGGQRSERKKWIHCFDSVNVVMFLVAISGYDQVLIEDSDSNQMEEALTLWETIANSNWFKNSALILFLNKMDLFREKVQSGNSPIAKYFPDFRGAPGDVKAGQDFFAAKFRALLHVPGKEIYIHYTNATDTDLLKKTMNSVQDMIVQRNINNLI